MLSSPTLERALPGHLDCGCPTGLRLSGNRFEPLSAMVSQHFWARYSRPLADASCYLLGTAPFR